MDKDFFEEVTRRNRAALIAAALFFSFLALSAESAYAHAPSFSFEKTVEGKLIYVGYDSDPVEAGVPMRFDFSLSDAASGEETSFTDIWVRVERGSKTVFAGGIAKAWLGETGMLFAFPEAGSYTLALRFQNDGEELAEASFQIPVAAGVADGGSTKNTLTNNLLVIVGGALVGAFLGYAAVRMPKRGHAKK